MTGDRLNVLVAVLLAGVVYLTVLGLQWAVRGPCWEIRELLGGIPKPPPVPWWRYLKVWDPPS